MKSAFNSAFRHVVWFITEGKGGGLGVIELLFLQQPTKQGKNRMAM